ncbi:hypothetical protein [Candidatus Vampirococcus lugosii]|uniref:Uncharacterized protein n=1 Tax=Candidatus Vampirococcus lugosii TaxID=2789015 RepID=A0ABS5QKC1_9BACT|nr:hypothetical protein [Candidatus Vampirococcus lugosii]MBS8121685.1 hypothetical protein [Candidatus Vampirococcus lugosii]
MEINLYDGEKFERTKVRYISFVTLYVFFILISLLSGNITGVILLFLFLGGYMFFNLLGKNNIKAKIFDEGLKIGNKFIAWSNVHGFVLELDDNTNLIKNIVFLVNNTKLVHTLNDDNEKIKEFILNLNDKCEMLSYYDQTFVDKIIRKLKI